MSERLAQLSTLPLIGLIIDGGPTNVADRDAVRVDGGGGGCGGCGAGRIRAPH